MLNVENYFQINRPAYNMKNYLANKLLEELLDSNLKISQFFQITNFSSAATLIQR